MKTKIPMAALFFSASLGASSLAAAQTQNQQELPAPARTINLSLEQRHTIKEIVKDLNIEKAPADLKMSVGGEVPAKVELRAIPVQIGEKVPQIKSHKFFVTEDKVVIVDSKDNKVAEIID